VARPLVLGLFAMLVVIWSSTWVAIKFGLEDTPPLFGAGIRFALAGAVLLAVTVARRRPLRTDAKLVAILAALPFALSYGLVYWGEQYIPSGLAAVLFGVMPLYVAVLVTAVVPEERISARLLAGLAVAFGGLALGFSESLDLGSEDRALLGALALLGSPLAAAIGNVSIKLRAGALDAVVLNGWAMLGGGWALLVVSAATESWSDAAWTGNAIGAISYLAIVGSAVPFVVLTLLLRELPTVTVSYIPLLLPFGALAFGAALYDEKVTPTAAAGALLVAGGILVAQWRGRPTA
jgi:drug/metabolite transporter (DMT)-like permease